MLFESNLQSTVLRKLNKIPHCIAENVSGNSAQSGRADINGCINGQSFRIELKSPDHGNKATPKQKFNLRKWQRAGSIAFVAKSWKEVYAMLAPYMDSDKV